MFWTRYRDEVREKTDVCEGDPMHFPATTGTGIWCIPATFTVLTAP
ncbi:MAG: hypothetical protein ACLRSW_04245 [Christensenellaceae bacterium]